MGERKKVKLNVIGLSYNQASTSAYAIILETADDQTRIPVIISPLEANAIGIKLDNVKTVRPLTHDLFKSFAKAFEIDLIEVVIDRFSKGIFYAELICISKDNTIKMIDSRTSDAVALALRFNVPIYTYPEIVKETGIEKGAYSESQSTQKIDLEDVVEKNIHHVDDLSNYKLEELEEMIGIAVEKEEYEKASIIQKAINNLKQKNDD